MTGWRMRKGLRWLGVLVAVLTLAGGCGDGDDAPEAQSTVLRVLMTDDWVTGPFVDAVREFERTHPNVRVDIDKGPISDMGNVVRAGISSGAPPDVVQGHAHSGAGQQLAQPVDDLWQAHNITPQEFLPGAVTDVSWNGKLYGLPLDSNAMVILYNVDHFRAAGLGLPSPTMTFADFERMAQALTTPDGSRRGLVIPMNSWATYGWIRANGGEVLTVGPEGPKLSLDAPAVVDTLRYLQRLIEAGWAYPPVGPASRSSDAYALFRSGAASMHASGSWDLVRIQKEVPDGNFGVALMPRGLSGRTQGTAMGGSSLWIPVGSKHRELAFEFMLLLTSDPYALRFTKEEGRLPVRPRVLTDPYFRDPKLQVFVEQLATAYPPILGALNEASKAFEDALALALREHRDPGPALEAAQQRAVASLPRS